MKKENTVLIPSANNRKVTLTKHLGDGRWLCTDEKLKCHPCYDESCMVKDLY